MTRARILADLANILANFEGREYSGVIDENTLFFGELGLASIDAIVLAEKLDELYGRKLPFQSFLSQLKNENPEDLPIGRLVDFLAEHL